jgi:hypothetical protein
MTDRPNRTQTQVQVARLRTAAPLIGLVVLCCAIWLFSRSSTDSETVTLGKAPGGSLDDRTVDTSPFSLAEATSKSDRTTIPGDLGQGPTTQTTLAPIPTTTTSTTIPIPPRSDDPICGTTTTIIEALRIVTGPSGTTPENLLLAAAKFDETADLLEDTDRADLAALVTLTRKVADELPSATNDVQAAAVYNQLLAPTDPELAPVAEDFSQHLRDVCPELLTLEP